MRKSGEAYSTTNAAPLFSGLLFNMSTSLHTKVGLRSKYQSLIETVHVKLMIKKRKRRKKRLLETWEIS